MFRLILIFFLLLFACLWLVAQNNMLVNGDFELFSRCPESHTRYRSGVDEILPGWYIINASTPDIFNRCAAGSKVGVPDNFAGSSEPYSGNGYAGLIIRSDSAYYPYTPTYTEQLVTTIDAIPRRNMLYCFKFRYKLAGNSGIAANGLGAYFSTSRPGFSETQASYSFKPQMHVPDTQILNDNSHWNLFCGVLRSSGEERYISIGNFTNYTQQKIERQVDSPDREIEYYAYMFVDAFELYPVSQESQCPVTVICSQTEMYPEIFAGSEEERFIAEPEVGDVLILKNIFFDFDKYQLLPVSFYELDKVSMMMQQYPKLCIEIVGHTDNAGSDSYNQTLSEQRARSVFEYLYKSGIDLARMSFVGYGSKKPIADNNLSEGRQLNRRVEIKIIKK